jgi:hypothetical protein
MGLPQHEVPSIFLVVLVAVDPRSADDLAVLEVGQPAVTLEGFDAVVQRTLAGVGQPSLLKPDGEIEHLLDVLARPRVLLGAFDPQRIEILEEGLYIRLGRLLQGQPLRGHPLDDLVLDVGDVHDLRHLEAEELEGAAQQVLPDVGPEVSDVGVVVNRGTAGVHTDLSGLQRPERLGPAGHGVVDLHLSEIPSG